MTEGRRHRVLIVGGGFGGLFAAKFLRRAPVDVTLVDRINHHLFQPLLYQLATGILSEGRLPRRSGRFCATTRTSRCCSRTSLRSTSRTGASLPHVQSGRPSSSNTTRSSSQAARASRSSIATSGAWRASLDPATSEPSRCCRRLPVWLPRAPASSRVRKTSTSWPSTIRGWRARSATLNATSTSSRLRVEPIYSCPSACGRCPAGSPGRARPPRAPGSKHRRD